MPNLSQLTDYAPVISEQDSPAQQERIYVSPSLPVSDDGDYFTKPVAPVPELPSDNVIERIIKKLAETEFSPGTKIGNKLAGTGGEERYQLWPEKVVRSALTAIPDAYSGKIPMYDTDPETGELVPSQAMIGRAMDMATFAGVGGVGGTGEATGTVLGATPSLRPALKYNGRLYKGKEGQQHMDVIPDHLYNDFQQKAMSGDDISHYNFGFVNDKGHFLDREAALKYGIDTGLIDPQAGKFGALTSTLMADSSKPGMAIEATAKTAQPFYSAVEHTVNSIQQPKMTGEAWLGTLSNKPGVKPEELDWTGLKSFLEENKGKPVTKQQVQNFLAENNTSLNEVWKGTGQLKKAAEDLQVAAGGPTVVKGEKLYPDEIEQGLWDGSLTPKDLPTNLQPYAEKMMSLRYQQEQPTKYHSYQLPGGENYRELLMTLPVKTSPKTQEGLALTKRMNNGEFNSLNDVDRKALFAKRDQLLREGKAEEGNPYKSSHWDEPNILAHVRMNDRTIEGKKSLHLEEIQSDWHQQGRDKGYNTKLKISVKPPSEEGEGWSVMAGDKEIGFVHADDEASALAKAEKNFGDSVMSKGVPDAPFKKTWHELVLKRMLREAAEKGYDRLSWTPGEAQAARYDLSKQISELYYQPKNKKLIAMDKNGHKVMEQHGVDPEKVSDFVGKDVAKKLLETEYDPKNPFAQHILTGQDLKIGGEGMKGFYDQIIPKAISKISGEKVKTADLGEKALTGLNVKKSSTNIHGEDIYSIYDDTGKLIETDFKSKNAAEDAMLRLKFKENKSVPVHYIDIPQSLKDKAMQKGFPLFSTAMPGYMFKPVDGNPFDQEQK